MIDQKLQPPRNEDEVEETTATNLSVAQQEPKAPYFYYRDFSDLLDPDPSKPVTATGRIPNFPAKMMEILSRPDLAHIISWMPHGRSWKVHKPREFECKVIPTYFEHSKFSSFIRQANGWGFRRMISKGPDRNSYYHELFLRGQRHLIKLMKRPTSASRPQADANTEPDFYRISDEHPLPEPKIQDDIGISATQAHGVVNEYSDCAPDNAVTYHDLTPLPYTSAVPTQEQRDPPALVEVEVERYNYYQNQSSYGAHERGAALTTTRVQRMSPSVVTHTVSPRRQEAAPVWRVSSLAYEEVACPLPVMSFVMPANAWTETCLEPKEMPRDFEDPFAGGLRPVDFW